MGKVHTEGARLMRILIDPNWLIISDCLRPNISHWEAVLGQVFLVLFWPGGTFWTRVAINVMHAGRMHRWCRWDTLLSVALCFLPFILQQENTGSSLFCAEHEGKLELAPKLLAENRGPHPNKIGIDMMLLIWRDSGKFLTLQKASETHWN